MASVDRYSCYFLHFLALVIFLINVHPCLSLDPPTEERIERICRQMEEYGFCHQTFIQNIRTSSADFVELTQIALDQTTKNAANIHNAILQLLAKVTDQPTKNALIACENGYRVVMQAFQEAFGDFNRRDYDSMLKSERVAPRAQASCEITFITPPSPVDPLKERNRQMRILIAMALETGHNLLGH